MQREGGSGFVESCYVVYNEGESGVVRGIRCAAAGPGCPAGGSGDDRDANGRFLGRVIDPTLVLEAERGNNPPTGRSGPWCIIRRVAPGSGAGI